MVAMASKRYAGMEGTVMYMQVFILLLVAKSHSSCDEFIQQIFVESQLCASIIVLVI